MGTLNEDLTAIKAVEDKLTANKVANFAYTNHAYNNPLTEADGVETYDVNNEQNIPVANASIMKVNQTILTKGWRSQASSITRMLMNHFLGRCSYNLNKINDLMSSLLSTLMSHLGTANGLATLDANGYVPMTQLNLSKGDIGLGNVVNTGDSAVPTEDGTDKFTTGGAYTLLQAILGKAPTNHASSTTDYGIASDSNYGHVKTSRPSLCFRYVSDGNLALPIDVDIAVIFMNGSMTPSSPAKLTCRSMTYSKQYCHGQIKSGVSPTNGLVDLTVSEGGGVYSADISITSPALIIVMTTDAIDAMCIKI